MSETTENPIREAIGIDRDAIFRDFYDRLP